MRMRSLSCLFVLMLACSAAIFAQAVPKTIFDYRKELGLTTRQEGEIRAALEKMRATVNASHQKVKVIEGQVRLLIEKEAPLEQIRAKLQEAASLQINLRIVDIATSRRIREILTPEQRAKWRQISQRATR